MGQDKKRLNVREPERALLTDTFPYELPIFFHNANFAILARQYRLGKSKQPVHQELLLSLGAPGKPTKPTKPLTYEINKDSKSTRKLSLPHPKSQHHICQFYAKFEFVITNSCSRSAFSLRYPSRVATHYVDPRYVAKTERKPTKLQVDEDPAGFRDQSRWASTYFSYREFNLSQKFFESDDLLELERKYSTLLKLDVSQCFNSIYTHSIEWSMRGKQFSKDFLPSPVKAKTTFESEFDATIRHGNWNETHGILVGPESSRVFAEIVLQSADREVYRGLARLGIERVKIKRYVDDYFVFANSADDLSAAEALIASSLAALNLHLNASKKQVISRPFVAKLGVARHEVAASINRFFEISDFLADASLPAPEPASIERARAALVARLRQLSAELETPFDQFASFALTIFKRRLDDIAGKQDLSKASRGEGSNSKLSFLSAVIRSAQFLYSMDHRATTTLKLASVYYFAVDLAGMIGCARASLEGQMLDGLRDPSMGCDSVTADEITKINHICAVDLLLTHPRKLEIQDVARYLGDVTKQEDAENLSPFQLMAILFICRRRKRFSSFLRAACDELARRVSALGFKPLTDTADALVLTELLACPYLDNHQKIAPLRRAHMLLLGESCDEDSAIQILAESQWITFVDWAGTTDLASMLARKELTPAYE